MADNKYEIVFKSSIPTDDPDTEQTGVSIEADVIELEQGMAVFYDTNADGPNEFQCAYPIDNIASIETEDE